MPHKFIFFNPMDSHNKSRENKQATVHSFRKNEGFALIITLALLTFLILVLFAMTSLTRVETRMVGASQETNIARENAKLAMDTAIAQLQRYTGPDDRVTARSNINAGNNDRNPYWTGVWQDAGMGTSLMTWLVSGNEDSTAPLYFTPDLTLDRTMLGDPYVAPSSPGVSAPGSWYGAPLGFVRLVELGSSGDNVSASPDGEDPIYPSLNPSNPNYKVPGGVVVPKVPIFSREFPGLPSMATSTRPEYVVGHYAFWVGDQGVKASAALAEKHLKAEVDPSVYSYINVTKPEEEVRRRLRQMMPQRMWFEGDRNNSLKHVILNDYPQFNLIPAPNVNRRSENELLNDVMHYRQIQSVFADPPLPLLNPRPNFAIDTSTNPNRDQLKDRFHDITYKNYGVLANTDATIGGGLKLDLSAGAGPVGFQDYLNVPFSQVTAVNPALGTAAVGLFAAASLTSGEPALVIAPVVTELVTKYVVWQDPSGEMKIRLEANIELWNPYTVDLNLSSGALVLRLEDIGLVSVQHSYEATPKTISLKDSDANVIPLDQISSFPSSLEAGEVQHFSYISPDLLAFDGPASPPVSFSLTDIKNTPPVTAPSEIEELKASQTKVEFKLWFLGAGISSPVPGGTGSPLNSAIDTLSVEPVGEVISDNFDPFNVGPYLATDDTTLRFGYGFRMKDRVDDALWHTVYDPRTIGLENLGSIDAIEIESDPTKSFQMVLDDPLTPQQLKINSPSSRIRVFELPIQEQVNIGALQHLSIHKKPSHIYPAYSLGNDNLWNTDSVNGNFDEYFISAMPKSGNWEGDPISGGTGWGFPIPNTRLVPYQSIDIFGSEHPTTSELQAPESAEHLLVEGAFNINSTSLNAWRSVLGGLSIRQEVPGENFNPGGGPGEWIYAAGGASGIPLTSAVFRFPQTAHLLNSPYLNQTGFMSSSNSAYMQGVRELSEDQIYALAYEIVELLRNPPTGIQTPFLSLKDFVDSGILHLAIENCDLGNGQIGISNPISPADAIINGSIPKYSAAFVTQADLITLLAPFMAARSDTFIIRAYGDSHNPATGQTIATAYCEAIVQRVPATLDPTDDPVFPTGNFGRRYEVVYFRWMTPNEL